MNDPLPNDGTDKAARKALLRRAALARRDALPAAERATASGLIAANGRELLRSLRPAVVSGYWPMRSEADPLPLLRAAAELGAAPSLPVTGAEGLHFRVWRAEDAMIAEPFGTSRPPDTAPEVVPDLLLMPLAAFDRRGGRIGYGKAYYDRAIAALRADGLRPILVGIAFAAQEVPEVPTEGHDVPLQWIVTERELIEIGA